ncbi:MULTISPECIES: hypothetical protein [unclassified Mesorhizobium]|uniref:hypothetical protein n=1 Tax=unclassified Mesorhizobium TaxID=325217 RepID=UPI001FE01778|nr:MULTISPECIES: hypothetical protein [unclassified Mesorhizobium]
MGLAFNMRGVVAAAAFLVATAAQAGPDLGDWRIDTGSDGQVTASLHATNKLLTGGGALGYSPVLTLACRTEGEPRWSEWLQLSDAVSASRKITMSVMVDDGRKFDESWSVGPRGRMLVREGADGIRRLASASRLSLSWRFGLLSGRGEADFELAGLSEAVGRMAASCNTDPP